MSARLSRALMILAMHGLGQARGEWARAMWAEYQVAVAEGDGLAFASGCLFAAWKELPRHAGGRLAIATHAFALGFLIPLACLQLAWVLGLPIGLGDREGLWGTTSGGTIFLVPPQVSAAPALLILWTLLTAGHLRFAWSLMERSWEDLLNATALVGATTVTLLFFMAALLLNTGALLLPLTALAAELALIGGVAWRSARLSAPVI